MRACLVDWPATVSERTFAEFRKFFMEALGAELNLFYGFYQVLHFLQVFTSCLTGCYPPRHGFDDFCKIEKQAFLAILMHGSSSSQKIAPGTSDQTLKSRFLSRVMIFWSKVRFQIKLP